MAGPRSRPSVRRLLTRAILDLRFTARRSMDALVPHRGAEHDRVVVYTAILGPYDALPVVRFPDSRIDYVCFTDQPIAGGPWAICDVRSRLADPKLVVGYLKSQAADLFPHHVASCWMDANFKIIRISARDILSLASEGPFRAQRHPHRTDPIQELARVAEAKFDSPAALHRTQGFLEATTERFGPLQLPNCAFIVRDHTDARVQRLGALWWQFILSLSRRDQLTIGAALRLSGTPWRPLEVARRGYYEVTAHLSDSTRSAGIHSERSPSGFPLLVRSAEAAEGDWPTRDIGPRVRRPDPAGRPSTPQHH